MNRFNRNIETFLNTWRNARNRKPLIIRGARQVGKTTVIEKLSENYEHFINLNLEHPQHVNYFEKYDDVKLIVENILFSNQIPSTNLSSTLLFIDEIQQSPKAIHLLRYFYEYFPELHVIAAGSLLEFALSMVKSFPVGRVQYLYMYPLNFIEYLGAMDMGLLIEALQEVPLKKTAHSALLSQFNKYVIIGGMPEIIAHYKFTNNLSDLITIYESIWSTYKQDIEKYGQNNSEKKILRHIMDTGPSVLDKRVKFQNFGNSNYKSREVSEAMKDLDLAKVIRLIYPTTDLQAPIQSDFKKSPRLQFLDTGIINYTLNIQADLLGIEDLSYSFKGAIIPHIITQELISISIERDTKPNFWVRDKTQASAEVDLVFTYSNYVVPIEIKSGKSGTLKSLHQFIERVEHPYAVRFYGGEFRIEKHTTPGGKPYLLMNLPYYLGTKLPDYIEYFILNHKL